VTVTPTLTATSTLTPTPTATPVLALVVAGEAGGAHLRAQPSFQAPSLALLANGSLVQVLPDAPVEESGNVWIMVRTTDSKVGWILQVLLSTATPAPNW
jgi:DNA-binding transcriptional LysR family regulator